MKERDLPPSRFTARDTYYTLNIVAAVALIVVGGYCLRLWIESLELGVM